MPAVVVVHDADAASLAIPHTVDVFGSWASAFVGLSVQRNELRSETGVPRGFDQFLAEIAATPPTFPCTA